MTARRKRVLLIVAVTTVYEAMVILLSYAIYVLSQREFFAVNAYRTPLILTPLALLADLAMNRLLPTDVVTANRIYPAIALIVFGGIQWSLLAALAARWLFREPLDRSRPLCIQCGYDLTGNVSGRCPECGTPRGDSAGQAP